MCMCMCVHWKDLKELFQSATEWMSKPFLNEFHPPHFLLHLHPNNLNNNQHVRWSSHSLMNSESSLQSERSAEVEHISKSESEVRMDLFPFPFVFSMKTKNFINDTKFFPIVFQFGRVIELGNENVPFLFVFFWTHWSRDTLLVHFNENTLTNKKEECNTLC